MEKFYFTLATFAALLGTYLLLDKTKIVTDNVFAFIICVALAVLWVLDALKTKFQKSGN